MSYSGVRREAAVPVTFIDVKGVAVHTDNGDQVDLTDAILVKFSHHREPVKVVLNFPLR